MFKVALFIIKNWKQFKYQSTGGCGILYPVNRTPSNHTKKRTTGICYKMEKSFEIVTNIYAGVNPWSLTQGS